MKELRPVQWEDGKVKLIDQTRLPYDLVTLEFTDYRDVVSAIKKMQVRGAPAIGVAAALGIALGAQRISTTDSTEFLRQVHGIAREFQATRPTAVNLFWAINRMMRKAKCNSNLPPEDLKKSLVEEACAILQEDIEINRRLGKIGAELINDGDSILTHCNAGALATAGYGTALGVIRAAEESGKRIQVYAAETRPRLQGMKLTVWELLQYNISVTCITDNMAAWVMAKGKINCVIVGADRIAANGDTANKVGTYGVAVLARAHNIPFYVAAPLSTVDFSIPDGEHIPIEERCPSEVTHIGDIQIAPEGVCVLNPSFDITPSEYITAIITEKGSLSPPFSESLKRAGG